MFALNSMSCFFLIVMVMKRGIEILDGYILKKLFWSVEFHASIHGEIESSKCLLSCTKIFGLKSMSCFLIAMVMRRGVEMSDGYIIKV